RPGGFGVGGAGGGGVVQGLPVAIGTGRRSTTGSYGSGGDAGPWSGGSSPRSEDSGALEAGGDRNSRSSVDAGQCLCGRGAVGGSERCDACLRESGWR
ncbi:hypothetical protein LTR28_005695, partial [Elasticomyces elasticus]